MFANTKINHTFALAIRKNSNTFNVGVLGSSPKRITKKLDKTRQRKDNSYNIKVL